VSKPDAWDGLTREEKCDYFLSHRVGAEQTNIGKTLETAVRGWTPKVGRHYVSLRPDDDSPNYATRADAIAAARQFKQKCKDWKEGLKP
jgi:hypothetical protein